MDSLRTYETVFIVNAALEDTAIEAITTATIEFIKTNGGTVTTIDKWGRRRLAYPIRKKHNGYYVYVSFEAPAALLPKMERYFFLEENIIRHLTVKMTPQAIEFRKQFLENRAERVLLVGADRKAAEETAAKAAAQEDAASE